MKKRWFFKSHYQSRFPFYIQVDGLVMILDGILSFFSGFFGYDCDLYCEFCIWNIKQDIKRRRKNNA